MEALVDNLGLSRLRQRQHSHARRAGRKRVHIELLMK
jgi:hypothetical protein